MSIEEFFDLMDDLKCVYYEYIRLKKENEKLRKQCNANHKQIMDMARMSEEGLHNWIKGICEGKIKIK